MAFVNEYIAQEDIEKYGLNELWASYHDVLNKNIPDGKDWTIDRERKLVNADWKSSSSWYRTCLF